MRTFSKTATWSIIAFVITVIAGWMLTGDPIKGGWIAVLCRVVKIPVYYWHELSYRKWWPHDETPAIVTACVEQGSRRTFYDAPTGLHVALPTLSPVQHCDAG